MIKLFLMFASAILLIMQIPYLFSAWSGSRLDHWDWIFYLLSIPAAILATDRKKIGKCDYWALLFLLPVLFLGLTAPVHQINALAAASSVAVIFAAAWLLYSWNFASRMLPVAMILLLGTPSSSYQLSLVMMFPVWAAWLVKFLLGAAGFIWIYGIRRFDLQISKGTLFFSAALIYSCFLLMHTKELYFEGRSFVPEFSYHIGDFWGRNIEPDVNTKRFFATASVRQYRYTKRNVDISVLAVQCGKNIHEIHPASHCLRTSMWDVDSEKIVYLQDNFAVTEIDAAKGNTRILLWTWFSSEDFSTPGFLGFRKHYRNDVNYYTYQISVPVYNSDEEAARNELCSFIRLLKESMIK